MRAVCVSAPCLTQERSDRDVEAEKVNCESLGRATNVASRAGKSVEIMPFNNNYRIARECESPELTELCEEWERVCRVRCVDRMLKDSIIQSNGHFVIICVTDFHIPHSSINERNFNMQMA